MDQFGLHQIKKPRLVLEPIDPSFWTVDRERNVILIWTLGGSEEDPKEQHFALWWNGNVIYATLHEHAVGKFSEHVTTTWRWDKITMPEHLERRRTQILDLLTEALSAYQVGPGVAVASHKATFEF